MSSHLMHRNFRPPVLTITKCIGLPHFGQIGRGEFLRMGAHAELRRESSAHSHRIGDSHECRSQRNCCSEGGASSVGLLEVRVIENLVEARCSIANFSSFNRRSINWRSRSERLVLSNLRYRLMLLPCARRLATFRSIIGRPLIDINNRSNMLGNQVIPVFDLFDPKRGILIFTLRAVTAETHR